MKNSIGVGDCDVHQQRRPTMISARYRQREERRRVLKISANKLRKIEDPEASLCRSVLINNTMRQLQRENSCGETTRTRTRPDPSPTDLAIDTDECDVLLSHLYMPPTPRMLTSIDDDDPGIDDNIAPTKRPRFDDQQQQQQQQQQPTPTLIGPLSCSRASLLGDLHGPVYRSLVASLET